jgi:hypothetical protein
MVCKGQPNGMAKGEIETVNLRPCLGFGLPHG